MENEETEIILGEVEELVDENKELQTTKPMVQAYDADTAKLDVAQSFTAAQTFGTANITTVDLGNWTITESGGVLYFATGGTNKMKLDASGNLTVVGDVSAFGTV